VNLHAFLPGTYSSSIARQVWVDGSGNTWVAGEAWTGGLSHAVLWYNPIPGPGSLALLCGSALIAARRRR
jgi:hypothetical protein